MTYFALVIAGLMLPGLVLLLIGHVGVGIGLLIAAVTPTIALGTPHDFWIGRRRGERGR